MFSQLLCTNFRVIGIKDLTNTVLLLNHLDNPEKLQCIHVAGTNGKGSTAHMLASISARSRIQSRTIYFLI
jgi:folylpolyglutamate synthase/dihydropteroate synthase